MSTNPKITSVLANQRLWCINLQMLMQTERKYVSCQIMCTTSIIPAFYDRSVADPEFLAERGSSTQCRSRLETSEKRYEMEVNYFLFCGT